MSDNFCYVCGKKLIKIETGYYHTQTGEKRTVKQCPSGLCGHYGIEHDMLSKKVGKWFFSYIVLECRRCGKTEPDYDIL